MKKDDPLVKEIEKHRNRLGDHPRDEDLAYFLPWYFLISILDHIHERSKERVLRADKVTDRLEIIHDLIDLEIKIANNLEALTEKPPDPKNDPTIDNASK